MSKVKITDKGPHEPRLSHACSKGEAERREIALEVRHRRVLGPDDRKGRGQVGVLGGRYDLGYAVKYLQRVPLRLSQAETAGYGIYMAIHCCPFSGRRCSRRCRARWIAL